MKRPTIAIAILLLAGAALLPLQLRLQNDRHKEGLESTALDLSVRDRISQMGFLAALSGFRSFVAAVLWIDAHVAWENTDWAKMLSLLQTVTTLQPHSIPYWDTASWHMAWNASAAAIDDKSQPSEALRRRSQRQYIEIGKQFLEDGIKNNPDSATLRERLGMVERDKLEDHCAAADAFKKGSELPDARPYLARMAAYELAKCPGREQEAYSELRRLYDMGENQRMPAVIARLKELEEKLGIPEDQRIKDTLEQ